MITSAGIDQNVRLCQGGPGGPCQPENKQDSGAEHIKKNVLEHGLVLSKDEDKETLNMMLMKINLLNLLP